MPELESGSNQVIKWSGFTSKASAWIYFKPEPAFWSD